MKKFTRREIADIKWSLMVLVCFLIVWSIYEVK